MGKSEVFEAFEILLEEIETTIVILKDKQVSSIENGAYDNAKKIIEQISALEKFRDKVKNLQKEWQKSFSSLFAKTSNKRKSKNKLKKGLRTPEDAFRIPILEALVEVGGAASVSKVLELVESKMKNILNQYDYLPLSSNTVRWKNTAQWCRNTMVKEGLLISDSPRGIWKISEKGREYLKKQNLP